MIKVYNTNLEKIWKNSYLWPTGCARYCSTYHINYYLEGLLSAFRTGKLDISDKYSFDVPEISSESDWKALVQRFLTHAARFADAIEGLEEKRLEQPFIEERYGSYLRNIEGVIEHSYYHLGQIVLIKKLIVSQQTH